MKIPIGKYYKYLENAVFILVAATILYGLVEGFSTSVWTSLMGKGYVDKLVTPLMKKAYYKSVLALLSMATTFFILLELTRLIIGEYRKLNKQSKASNNTASYSGVAKFIFVWKHVVHRYKSNFLSKIFNEYLSKVIVIFVYALWMPYFEKYALFSIGNQWYWWIYAYFIWELSYWVWHYTAHRIRILWCLHSPHHAPSEMNLTVAWVHFFAEGYYTALIQVPILMMLGVKPAMVLVILVIDGTWGTFIHTGERSFKNGRFGLLQHMVITPSHHRVHHGKNPLYIDTNFCVLIPFWDWLFGTLQPERKEVKIEYGITREMDVTNFVDFYFGECILLIKDVKSAKGLKNKLLYLFMPPGWSPESRQKTASVVRSSFLKEHPKLGETSRRFLNFGVWKTGLRSFGNFREGSMKT
ncbi:MAG: sterol desaturase family protein [Bacteroidota bacterium]|nr:sterol desaturase family protein [Bacteroidota bacterium]